MIPIFVVHQGNQEYLKYCLASCRENHEVHLLGDEKNRHFNDNWINIKELGSSYIDEFNLLYKHMSTNNEWFEKICFYRYIYMYEYALKNNINEFFHCDSDLLVLNDLSLLKSHFLNYESAVVRPHYQSKYRYTASPHISFWTLKGLRNFIYFMLSTYRNNINILEEKYQYHLDNNIGGGICDMTLLYLYSLEYNVNNIFDMNDFVLDYNISIVENSNVSQHETLLGVKKIHIKNNELFFKYKNNVYKRVLCLHMQGQCKRFMKDGFYKKYHFMMSKVILLNLLKKMYKYLPRK